MCANTGRLEQCTNSGRLEECANSGRRIICLLSDSSRGGGGEGREGVSAVRVKTSTNTTGHSLGSKFGEGCSELCCL